MPKQTTGYKSFLKIRTFSIDKMIEDMIICPTVRHT